MLFNPFSFPTHRENLNAQSCHKTLIYLLHVGLQYDGMGFMCSCGFYHNSSKKIDELLANFQCQLSLQKATLNKQIKWQAYSNRTPCLNVETTHYDAYHDPFQGNIQYMSTLKRKHC